jgi:hypothetical protein
MEYCIELAVLVVVGVLRCLRCWYDVTASRLGNRGSKSKCWCVRVFNISLLLTNIY